MGSGGGDERQSSWEVVHPTPGSPWSPRGWDGAVTSCMQTSPLPTCRARRVSPGLDVSGDTQGMLLLVYSGTTWVHFAAAWWMGTLPVARCVGLGHPVMPCSAILCHAMQCLSVSCCAMRCRAMRSAVPTPPASQAALSPPCKPLRCSSTAQSEGARHFPWALAPLNLSFHLGLEALLPSNSGPLFHPYSRQDNWTLW